MPDSHCPKRRDIFVVSGRQCELGISGHGTVTAGIPYWLIKIILNVLQFCYIYSAIRPSVCVSVCWSHLRLLSAQRRGQLGEQRLCQATGAVRTADPSAHGRRSAAIGGGISSRRAIICFVGCIFACLPHDGEWNIIIRTRGSSAMAKLKPNFAKSLMNAIQHTTYNHLSELESDRATRTPISTPA